MKSGSGAWKQWKQLTSHILSVPLPGPKGHKVPSGGLDRLPPFPHAACGPFAAFATISRCMWNTNTIRQQIPCHTHGGFPVNTGEC